MIFNEDELDISIEEDLELIESLIVQHIALTNKYEAVITNPPYMGGKGFSQKLKAYVEKNYKDSKSDLFAVFIERCNNFTKKECYTSMITMQSWMFLSSFETLRKNIIKKLSIINLIHMPYLGKGGTSLGINFGTVSFILKKSIKQIVGVYQYIRYFECDSNGVPIQFPTINERYKKIKQENFNKIPGSPISYWVSDKVREIFENFSKLENFFEIKEGIKTADNERFIKEWWSINNKDIYYLGTNLDEKKYIFTTKGGDFRKWYGNLNDVLFWANNGYDLKNFKRSTITNEENFFKDNITWNRLTTAKISFRYTEHGSVSNMAGLCMYKKNLKDEYSYFLSFFNTKIVKYILDLLNPTLNFPPGLIKIIPFKETNFNLERTIENYGKINISISKEEWDSRETSWDFEKLSLIDGKDLKSAYENYCSHWRDNFVQLHKNEEELNRLFIEIYDLQDEMDEKVSFDDITILKKEAKIVEIDNSKAKEFSSESERYLYDRGVSLEFNKDELIKQFLSYAIGCIMGRYSIDKPGLIMANSDDVLELSSNKFFVKDANGDIRQEVKTEFLPDEFGILPITAEKDFSNDIVERVKEFVKFVYGEESLKDNLNFIAKALGNKDNKSAEEIIRTYFITTFYKDHLQRYQNRPIYWLMNSGKKNAFSCLFYMHRYEALTIARVRADYLIHYQEMLENKRKFIERQLSDENISANDKKKVEKELKDLDVLLKELREYANEVKHIAEQKIPLDLDDGVNVNYEKLGAILKKR